MTASSKQAAASLASCLCTLPATLMQRVSVYSGDNLPLLGQLAAKSFELIYVDPPFNTGQVQQRTQIRTVRDAKGDRTGFGGKRYRTEKLGSKAYADSFDDYLGFLRPRLERSRELLADNGSLMVHLDYREVHYVKVMLDEIFGRASFINEIIWSYDYGARTKRRWSPKHDTILWYAKNPSSYIFDADASDRIPYMAPGLVGPQKAKRGKLPTDSWWHTIVPPGGREATGYPTQKPLGIIRRIVAVHSRRHDRLLDFFAGSGTLAVAALELDRQCTLIDSNPQAIKVIMQRLQAWDAAHKGS